MEIYTINHLFCDTIEKRKALKITDKTVTFEGGRRENLISDRRAHFATLEAAIEYFELWHKCKAKHLHSQARRLENAKAFFDEFVAKEIEGMAW